MSGLVWRVFLLVCLVAVVVSEDEDEEGGSPYGGLTLNQKVETIVSGVINRYCEGDHGFTQENDQAISQMVRDVLLSERDSCANAPDVNPTAAPETVSSGPCVDMSTINLTESWRKDVGSNLRPIRGLWACDRILQNGATWFRFSAAAGEQLSNRCRPSYSCGGHGGFWSDAEMPAEVGEVKDVEIYGSWGGNCYRYLWPVQRALKVQRCSERAGDFVYQVTGTGSCFWSFCSMSLGEN